MTTSPLVRIPSATYRLQVGPALDFDAAAGVAGYLDALGVTDAYISPPFQARAGSPHGYDVVDHQSLNPELGGEAGFTRLAESLSGRGMGILLDIVPNHMGVAAGENAWWNDVLENGRGSPYARYFDVDWRPPKADLVDKLLLPILGDQYGRVLEDGKLKVAYEEGGFAVIYYEHRLPVAPRSWALILEPALERMRAALGPDQPPVLELESILTALAHLPLRTETDPDRVRERQREKGIIRRRLAALADSEAAAARALSEAIGELNGGAGTAHRMDRLDALLAEQGYRLSHWRVASDEINYRRFFDVNELAAVRVEEPEVFEAIHRLAFRLFREGAVQGLRIDHVDGLYDPADYLGRLPGGAYVVVEKIITGDERLSDDWPVQGTTGYDFLNLVGGLFVDPAGRGALEAAYARFTGAAEPWATVAYESRKLALDVALSSELTVLARRLDRISEQHPFSRDFTLNSLQAALREVIACFPVYRSYVRPDSSSVDGEDRRHIDQAVRLARRRNPATSESVFDFVASVLLLQDPPGLDDAQRNERREFVMRFQQLTGPVVAKGVEDTASYRYYPLASLNEVGGEPASPTVTPARFHQACAERVRRWPHTLNATSTHDTKRDEDVRARIAVLSEVPEAFAQALERWHDHGAASRAVVDEAEAPDADAEYLLYQTLFGTWPASGGAAGYVERIQAYMRKALREAKLRTSWVSPNEPYERAVDDFIASRLDSCRGRGFQQDFHSFAGPLLRPGLLNSLSQTLLKVAAPGVPDFYQGTEMWEFNLVDPDNRRPVDFARRRLELGRLDAPGEGDDVRAAGLLDAIEDGRLKLFLTSRSLRFRRSRREVFDRGDYRPLAATGTLAGRVVAFSRAAGGQRVLAVAARFFTRLPWPPVGPAWEDASLEAGDAPGTVYRDVFTGRRVGVRGGAAGAELPLREVFARLPFALLERVS